MDLYTLGLMFDPGMQDILLLKKNRPHKGLTKLSGPGGAVDSDDISPMHAFIREVHEETGILLECSEVELVGRVVNASGQIELFLVKSMKIYQASTQTDEEVEIMTLEEMFEERSTEVEDLMGVLINILETYPDARIALNFPLIA